MQRGRGCASATRTGARKCNAEGDTAGSSPISFAHNYRSGVPLRRRRKGRLPAKMTLRPATLGGLAPREAMNSQAQMYLGGRGQLGIQSSESGCAPATRTGTLRARVRSPSLTIIAAVSPCACLPPYFVRRLEYLFSVARNRPADLGAAVVPRTMSSLESFFP